MPFEVSFTERATADVTAIVDYLMEIDPDLAMRIYQGIVDHIEGFRDNPFVGEIIKTTRLGVLRESLCRSYRIFFAVDEPSRNVSVVRVRHVKRRNLKSLE